MYGSQSRGGWKVTAGLALVAVAAALVVGRARAPALDAPSGGGPQVEASREAVVSDAVRPLAVRAALDQERVLVGQSKPLFLVVAMVVRSAILESGGRSANQTPRRGARP